MVPFIQTRDGVAVFVGTDTFEIHQTDSHYQPVIDVLKSGVADAEQKIINIVQSAINKVKQAIAASPSNGVTLSNGTVYFNGEPLHNTLTDRMLGMIDQGFDVDPLIKFLENLMKNPSFRVVNELYSFLEVGKNAITPDGYFLAYKAVREDFLDIHSGTIDNSIGKVVEIPRNQVDENPDRTCSHGLHVCSWDYLPSFAHSNGHVVIVKVNPADVVAIPSDYNNTKMRCSRYEVVDEYKDYYTTDPQGLRAGQNILAQRSVIGDYYQAPQLEILPPVDSTQAEIENELRDNGFDVVRTENGFVATLDLSIDEDQDLDELEFGDGSGDRDPFGYRLF